jgi:hypothetical protein
MTKRIVIIVVSPSMLIVCLFVKSVSAVSCLHPIKHNKHRQQIITIANFLKVIDAPPTVHISNI